jgi:hypothetical protein
MSNAIHAVRRGEMGTLKASKQFSVPRTTLQRALKTDGQSSSKKPLGSRKTIFSPEMEAELVQHIKEMENRLFGFTPLDLRRVAFQFAEANDLQHPFSMEDKAAGKDWLQCFLSRHRDLAVRTPENTSAARAAGFNQVSVGKYFDLLEHELDAKHFTPDCIYNVDETGITTVPNKPSKIIATRGKKQVGTLTSGERGQLVTVVICMSASGNYIPPFFIFPRARMKGELLDHTPPGSVATAHKSGWMQTEIFVEWFKHFLSHCRPDTDRPILLILDGHKTHTLNLDVINLAREKCVTLLCLPPHCSHRLQPLDVGFMKPLMTYYSQEAQTWLRNHPGRIITMYQVGEIFGAAYLRAATVKTAVKAFETTGISPCNRHIFDDSDFAPSSTTERPLPQSQVLETAASVEPSVQIPEQSASAVSSSEPLVSTIPPDLQQTATGDDISELQATCSDSSTVAISEEQTPAAQCPIKLTPPAFYKTKCVPKLAVLPGTATTPRSVKVHITEVSPLPQSEPRPASKNRARGQTVVLTSSPYKQQLENHKSVLSKTSATPVTKCRKKSEARKKREVTSRKKCEPGRKRKLSLSSKRQNKRKHPMDDTDAACLFCQDKFSSSTAGEQWIQCIVCGQWAHVDCAGSDDVHYSCDLCAN